MIFKTGHKDFPSVSTYTNFLQDEGENSSSAAAYLARYSTDEDFVRRASIIKAAFSAANKQDFKKE